MSNDLSYYEWLQYQPSAFKQVAIKGAKNARDFESGDMTKAKFDRLKIGKRFAPSNLDELRASDGLVLGE